MMSLKDAKRIEAKARRRFFSSVLKRDLPFPYRAYGRWRYCCDRRAEIEKASHSKDVAV